MSNFPKKVVISGQTHGNEWTGTRVVEHLLTKNLAKAYPNLEILPILANPKSYQLGRRYVDQDLNRSFSFDSAKLGDSNTGNDNYELCRAEEIKAQIDSFKQDDDVFILDLHTTTSDMGSSLVMHDTSPQNISILSYLKSTSSYQVEAYAWKEQKPLGFLNSLSTYGFAIEVGPVAWCTNKAETYNRTLELVELTLKFLNAPHEFKTLLNSSEEVFMFKENIDYPRDTSGSLSAIISSEMEQMNFRELKKDTPVFQKLNGENLYMPESAGLTPVFINEAAYYEKGIAFSLTEKISIKTGI